MSVQERLESLKVKHAELESAVHSEQTRANPDESTIHHLKRKKLRIKDEIARLAQA